MVHEPLQLDAASLRQGQMYALTTSNGRQFVGEYLGIEVTHGDWSMLMHTAAGVVSLPLRRIASAVAAAA